MQATVPSRADALTLVLMAVCFLTFGIFTILHPEKVRAAMDNFADAYKKGSWHPYRMPLPALRLVVGSIGIAGGCLFLYMLYVALTR
jgi:hypothetical protein